MRFAIKIQIVTQKRIGKNRNPASKMYLKSKYSHKEFHICCRAYAFIRVHLCLQSVYRWIMGVISLNGQSFSGQYCSSRS